MLRRRFAVLRALAAALPAALPAQAAADPVRQQWHGSGSADGTHLQVVPDAEALARLWRERRPGEAAPALDFDDVAVVAMSCGAAGEVRLVEVLRGEHHVVLRLQPVRRAAAAGAYGVFALARGAVPAQIECDLDWQHAGAPRWQPAGLQPGIAVAAPLPAGTVAPAPLDELSGLAPAATGAQWIDDIVALQRLLPRHAFDAASPDVDFARCGVLCVRTEAQAPLQWQPALLGRDRWVLRLRLGDVDTAGKEPRAQAWIVPRPRLPLAVEIGRATSAETDGALAWRELARLSPSPPAASPRLTLLRCAVAYDSGCKEPLCRRIDSASAWRELQRQVALPEAVLARDWVDFGSAAVILVATGEGRVWPGFGFAIGDEEDVDVLTLLQRAPSGRDPGLHTPMVVVQVPRRAHELAVVLRLSAGPAPAGEQTLGHFEALR